MIFNNVFAAALRRIGALAAGEVPGASDATDGFLTANDLIDSWNTERLYIAEVGFQVYVLTSTQQIYPIGPTATAPFNAARPLRIEKAGIVYANPGGTGLLRTEVALLTFEQWAGIKEKSAAGTTPSGLYCDYAYPNANLYLYPVPTFTSSPRSLELYTWTALGAFPDQVTDVPVAPGYERAFTLAFAIELATDYDREVSPTLQNNADKAVAAIRAMNAALPGQMPTTAPLDATPAQAQQPQPGPQVGAAPQGGA